MRVNIASLGPGDQISTITEPDLTLEVKSYPRSDVNGYKVRVWNSKTQQIEDKLFGRDDEVELRKSR